MKNLKKAGFISIEFLIVAGLVLIAGLIGLSAFVANGKQASGDANNKISEVLASVKAG